MQGIRFMRKKQLLYINHLNMFCLVMSSWYRIAVPMRIKYLELLILYAELIFEYSETEYAIKIKLIDYCALGWLEKKICVKTHVPNSDFSVIPSVPTENTIVTFHCQLPTWIQRSPLLCVITMWKHLTYSKTSSIDIISPIECAFRSAFAVTCKPRVILTRGSVHPNKTDFDTAGGWAGIKESKFDAVVIACFRLHVLPKSKDAPSVHVRCLL